MRVAFSTGLPSASSTGCPSRAIFGTAKPAAMHAVAHALRKSPIGSPARWKTYREIAVSPLGVLYCIYEVVLTFPQTRIVCDDAHLACSPVGK